MSDSETTYNALNRERLREYKKQWREKNKDKIKESNKKWRLANADDIKKKKAEYYKSGYYNNKLIQKFNIMKGEILIGNDSEELLDELKHLVHEMYEREIIDEEEYENIVSLF